MKDIEAGIRFPGLSVSGVSKASNPVVSAIATGAGRSWTMQRE